MSKLGFRSKAEAQCVRELTGRGWHIGGRNGQNHMLLVWPETGATLLIPGRGPSHFYVKVLKAASIQEQAISMRGAA